jgi:hypothetical protein
MDFNADRRKSPNKAIALSIWLDEEIDPQGGLFRIIPHLIFISVL